MDLLTLGDEWAKRAGEFHVKHVKTERNRGKWMWTNMDMGVSINGGTPKTSILVGFSSINHPFLGYPINGNSHIGKYASWELVPWWIPTSKVLLEISWFCVQIAESCVTDVLICFNGINTTGFSMGIFVWEQASTRWCPPVISWFIIPITIDRTP